MADNPYHNINNPAYPSDSILDLHAMYDLPYNDWDDYFAAQNLEQAGLQFIVPVNRSPALAIDREEYAYDLETGSQDLMAAVQALTYESARLPMTPQEQRPSLVTSATSSQSHISDVYHSQCITPDLSFPQSHHVYTHNNIDPMVGGIEAWADSSASALGLGLGGEVTVPTFGWAALTPRNPYASTDSTEGSQYARQYLCPPSDMYNGQSELAGSSHVSLPSPNPWDTRPRATSVAVCVEGNISIDLTPPIPASIPFTTSLTDRHVPLPSLVLRSISARQHRTRHHRGFPYIRSEHIRTIADKDKEHFNKTTPWDQEEIRVLNEVSDDYDFNFRVNMGVEAGVDRISKWNAIADHVRMALPTPRSRHQILIQAEKLGLKPSTTAPARRDRQVKHREKGL